MIYPTSMLKRTGNLFVFFLTITFLCLTSATVNAQMFSIDTTEQNQQQPALLRTTAGTGISFASFTFQGDESYDPELEFNGNLIHLFFTTPGLEAFSSFGGGLTGLDNISYFNIGARIYNLFAIKRSESLFLGLPIQLSTDLTQVTSSTASTDFRQSTLTAGTGLSGIVRLSDRISFNLKATPNYGFSFSQGSLFGGSVFKMDGRALLTADRILGRHALSIGYHFDFKSYNIDTDRDDYNFTAHTLLLGITF